MQTILPLAKKVNEPFFTRCESLSLLLPHYYLDFIADLVLVFGVIIRQVVFAIMYTFAHNFGMLVSHEISTFSFCFFSFHFSLESSVSVEEFRWFAYTFFP